MPTVTLHKVAKAAMDRSNLAGGLGETVTDHVGQGFLVAFHDTEIDGTQVRRGDRKVILRGHTIPDGVVVTTEDRVTVGSVEYEIMAAWRDTAEAQWVIHARGPVP
jgi:hypothetical protein